MIYADESLSLFLRWENILYNTGNVVIITITRTNTFLTSVIDPEQTFVQARISAPIRQSRCTSYAIYDNDGFVVLGMRRTAIMTLELKF